MRLDCCSAFNHRSRSVSVSAAITNGN